MVSWQTDAPSSACSCFSRPAALPASAGQVLGGQGEVAAEAAVAVAEAVPAQLPVDGGRVAAEPGRDLADRDAGLDEAEQGAALVEVELAVGPGQGRLRGANPCKDWGFALRDRTHRRLPSRRSNVHYGKWGWRAEISVAPACGTGARWRARARA